MTENYSFKEHFIGEIFVKPFFKNPKNFIADINKNTVSIAGSSLLGQVYTYEYFGKIKTASQIKSGNVLEFIIEEAIKRTCNEYNISFKSLSKTISKIKKENNITIHGETADIHILINDNIEIIFEIKQSDGHDTGNWHAISDKVIHKSILCKNASVCLMFDQDESFTCRNKLNFQEAFQNYKKIYVLYGINACAKFISEKVFGNINISFIKDIIKNYNIAKEEYKCSFNIFKDSYISNWTEKEKSLFKKKYKKLANAYFNSIERNKELEHIISYLLFSKTINPSDFENIKFDYSQKSELEIFFTNE